MNMVTPNVTGRLRISMVNGWCSIELTKKLLSLSIASVAVFMITKRISQEMSIYR